MSLLRTNLGITRTANDPVYGHNGGVSLEETEYDCTSFLAAVLGIPRHSVAEWMSSLALRSQTFESISPFDLRPGDVRIFQYGNGKGHADIYLGGGLFAEAVEPPGDGVGIRGVNADTGGVRIISGGSWQFVLDHSHFDSVMFLRPKTFAWGSDV